MLFSCVEEYREIVNYQQIPFCYPDIGSLAALPCNSEVNRQLRKLAGLCGIKKRITYHVRRHSFASLITLEAGVPIETISRMLGHSDISTTQVYARVSPKKLFEDMDKFIEATHDFKLTL